jgi:sulfide:quinone oxidoreductase
VASAQSHHRSVIVGGGDAGISVAARLLKAGETDVAVVEPSDVHYYQPLWTLVGGGCAPAAKSVRPEVSVMPKAATWIKDRAVEIDPEAQTVGLGSGGSVGYDFLVVCPGLALDWDRLPGATETLGRGGVSSNYQMDLAPKTWDFIKGMRRGTAVFSMPSGPIKCAGAPQKIAYLAADWWRKQGVLDDIHVVLVLPTPAMFGVPEFSKILEGVAARYKIDVRLQHEVVEVNPDAKEVVIANRSNGADDKVTLGYDIAHLVPPPERSWVDQVRAAGRPGQPGRLRPDRQGHHAPHPVPERVQPRGRRVVAELEDRGSDPQAGTGGGGELEGGNGRQGALRCLRRVRVMPVDDVS